MPGSRRLPFVQVDVFTSRPLEGNALAVFPDARGLSDEEMQAIARETHLSETTFVFPDPEASRSSAVRARIFTVEEELPFAGHPTLGTAAVLRPEGAARVALALRGGAIPVSFEDRPDGTFCEMRQRDPVFGARHAPSDAAAVLGIDEIDLDERYPVETVSTGLATTLVAVQRLATLRSLRPDPARLAAWLAATEAKCLYVVTTETWPPEVRLRARMFHAGGEDPGTGSAAGCAAGWMVRHGLSTPGEQVMIEQGLELRRPCRLFVRAGAVEERITDVHVGGYVVEVARGEFSV
jgi:trans-2,3-dihydro-3-hydroxyanthranilate isomerase